LPGDIAFVNYFDQHVSKYTLYNYLLDAVPTVPGLFGYKASPRATRIRPMAAQADIHVSLACNHHVVCYAAMLERARRARRPFRPTAAFEGDGWKD
jgi:hypothetical protein